MSHIKIILSLGVMLVLTACAQVGVPGARNVDIPSPTVADKRENAVNEKPDSVLYLPLGSDVLVPERLSGQSLPKVTVGPFELRSETLAGALQLILSDYEIPMAFETEEGLTRTITVTNLKGTMDSVVNRVCSLADLYCSFEDGVLTIKETQVFTVSVPPVGGENDVINSLATGIQAITGIAPIVEIGTRTLIYEATSRTAKIAERYLQRLRANTALVVFEIYIWEVTLDSGNATGVNWTEIADFGNFSSGISFPGAFSGLNAGQGVSIGLPTKDIPNLSSGDVIEFLSEYGAVKAISQPQITVMSGGSATLRVADTEAYVSSLSRTVDDGEVSISTETDTVDTGFTMVISSKWDNATVYSNIDIELQEVNDIETFAFEGGSEVGLPLTIERELQTQVRVRPGDSLLIAGLVREGDSFNKSGPGFSNVLVPTSRTAKVENRELVFLLRPRVVVYTDDKKLLRKQEDPSLVTQPFLMEVDSAMLNPFEQEGMPAASVQKAIVQESIVQDSVIMSKKPVSVPASEEQEVNEPEIAPEVEVEDEGEGEGEGEVGTEFEPTPEASAPAVNKAPAVPLNLLNPAL